MRELPIKIKSQLKLESNGKEQKAEGFYYFLIIFIQHASINMQLI